MVSEGPRAYLDHNATSPQRADSRRATIAALERCRGNPASLHAEGRAARAELEQARLGVAELAGAAPGEIVFTSGGSEAIAAAVRGVCDRAPAERRRIVVGAVEHSAVLEPARALARHGFSVTEVPCDAQGRVSVGRFLAELGPGTALAALQWANNETGVIQPVEEIARACREQGVALLVDAVQAAGKIEIDRRRVPADMIALSGHKIGGPQGTGALVVRSGIALAPLIGGTAETRRRGGTPAVAALVGFGAAAGAAARELREETTRLLRLRARIERRLRESYPDVRLHGQAAVRLPNTTNFALPGVPGELLVIALDLAGFALSTGSACASGGVEPSHVIRAMGLDEQEARGAVRISLGWSTTAEEVDRFLAQLPAVVERIRSEQAQAGRVE